MKSINRSAATAIAAALAVAVLGLVYVKIHVSPGVGNVGGMRINCRPEISVLDLRF